MVSSQPRGVLTLKKSKEENATMEWGWKEQQAANTLVIVGTQKILTWVDLKKIIEYFVGYGFFY